MTTVTDKYRTLVERLYKRTVEKKIRWEDNFLDNSISTQLAGRTIELNQGTNDDGEPVIVLRLYEGSNTLEVFNDESLRPHKPRVGQFETYWPLMSDMYEQAIRQAKGADTALDDVLDELDDEIPF